MDGHEFGRASTVRVVAYQVPLDTRVARVKAITLGSKKSAHAAYITETTRVACETLSEGVFHAACFLYDTPRTAWFLQRGNASACQHTYAGQAMLKPGAG